MPVRLGLVDLTRFRVLQIPSEDLRQATMRHDSLRRDMLPRVRLPSSERTKSRRRTLETKHQAASSAKARAPRYHPRELRYFVRQK